MCLLFLPFPLRFAIPENTGTQESASMQLRMDCPTFGEGGTDDILRLGSRKIPNMNIKMVDIPYSLFRV